MQCSAVQCLKLVYIALPVEVPSVVSTARVGPPQFGPGFLQNREDFNQLCSLPKFLNSLPFSFPPSLLPPLHPPPSPSHPEGLCLQQPEGELEPGHQGGDVPLVGEVASLYPGRGQGVRGGQLDGAARLGPRQHRDDRGAWGGQSQRFGRAGVRAACCRSIEL